MQPDSRRWVEVTPSEFAHERAGLAAVRHLLPDADPYRAWSNFTFTAADGRLYEVDLLVVGRSGLHLVELKHWQGALRGDGQTWWHNGHPVDNPRLLAEAKAKRLRSLLEDVSRDKGLRTRVPYVTASVLLHAPGTVVQLDDQGRQGVYGLDGQGPAGLPAVVADLLTAPAGDVRNVVDRTRSREIAKLLDAAGIRRSVRLRQVGTLLLDEDPIAEGPGWQDYLGHHTQLDGVVRRVRIYLVHKAATAQDRATILRAARREFALLEGVQHPGIARAVDFVDHERGPAVVFEHDTREVRLDHYLAQHPDLDVGHRLGIVSTLASTIRYAHGRRLVHRRLSPRSVYVRQTSDGHPAVRIRDWQTAGRLASTATLGTVVSGTRHLDALTDPAAAPFLAPDGLTNPDADGVLLDVFGLGALAYLVFTGRPPARSTDELLARLAADGGLFVTADLDGVPEAMEELVYEATQGDVDLRMRSAAEFSRGVEKLLDELTAPDDADERVDPLEAVTGSRLGTPEHPDRFVVVDRLGRGSTAQALLVDDHATTPPRRAVLKVALDESSRSRLVDEAEVLRRVRNQRIAALLDGPLDVGGRTCLLLEDAGREPLDELLRREGRLSIDLLERWGTDLMKILEALDDAGVNHRDIKPANLAHRELNQKTRAQHLALFDFSLSRAPLEETKVGTPPYLDPFFHPVHRPRWDAAAERYAAAVTLYEMATGALPTYGGEANPAVVADDITIDPELFDPAVADGLSAFFATALARDPKARHDGIDAMARAWAEVFASVPTAHEGESDAEPLAGAERDRLAQQVGLQTPIGDTGLTPRAVSALTRIGIATVGDLLERPAFEINRLAGVSEATRREVRRRAKQWRQQLAPASTDASTVTTAPAPEVEGSSVDAVLAALVPAETSRNTSEVHPTRLLLGLTGPDDDQAATWQSQAEVARRLGVSSQRVTQIVRKARDRWARVPALQEVRDEVVQLVQDAGGVAGADEVALGLLRLRGSTAPDAQRLARGLGLVRAAVEVEQERGGDSRLDLRRTAGTVLLAVEPDAADAPAAATLLDYAVALGAAADELAAEEPLPSAARSLDRLQAVRAPEGLPPLAPDRLPRVAVAASRTAAVTSRGEIYPAGMPPERSLRQLAGSFSGLRNPLTAQQLSARVRTRYPQAAPLPEGAALEQLVVEAGLPLRPDGGRFVPLTAETFAGLSGTRTATTTRAGETSPTAEHSEFVARMRTLLGTRGFLTLAVDRSRLDVAPRVLASTFGLEVVDVARELLTEMHQVADDLNVDWSLVLRADRPDAAPGDAANLRHLVGRAAARVEERLAADPQPLLLVEAEVLARYGRLRQLEELADPATARPATRWLLVAADGDGRAPRLDDKPAPTVGGWVTVPRSWVDAALVTTTGRAS